MQILYNVLVQDSAARNPSNASAWWTSFSNRYQKTTKKHLFTGAQLNRQLSILPGRRHPSTFDVQVLNYCVRNGNRWNHLAIATRYYVERCSLKTSQKIEITSSILVLNDLLPNRLRLLDKSVSGQRLPIIFALRARFLGRFRIRVVSQSLSLLDNSVS